MPKTWMKVRANITACADAYKAARLAVDNQRNKTTNIADSDGEAEIDLTNVELAEFGVYTETSLADNICETRRKQAIDTFMKCSNNNLITSLIMNIGAKSATHIEESLTIYYCQVDELDHPDIGNIDHISKNVVSSWQEIIHRGSQLTEVDTDMNIEYDHHNFNSLGHPDSLTGILELIIGKIEMSEKQLIDLESSRLGNNPQAITLCDIIQDQLPFNHLQRVIIEEVLNYAILNKEN